MTKIYLVEFRSDATIGDFAGISFAEHGEIVLMREPLDVRTRNSLGDRLVPQNNR